MLLLLLLALAQPAPHTPAGLWQAQRDYGPAMRGGALVLRRTDVWTAEINGMQASAPRSDAPRFLFPDGSELRMRTGSATLGQWIQAGNAEDSERIATPVKFTATSRGNWTGVVRPVRDVQHLLLYVRRMNDDTLQAFLRNPERNAGARVGLRSMTVNGRTVRLSAAGAPDLLGSWDAVHEVLVLDNPGLPGRFLFHRAAADSAAPYAYAQPAALADGWQTGTLAQAGIDPAAISEIVNSIRSSAPGVHAPYLQALLLARHGRLVLDEYFNGYDASPHDVRSAGKSVTALLVGRAMEDSHAFTPESRIAEILTQYAPFANDDARKQQIRVKHLLSMSAGYACDDNDENSPGNEDAMQSQQRRPDWYEYTLDLPMLFMPGTNAVYCSAEINLLGAVITRATGAWLPDYFYDRFAAPMQFGDYGMWLTPPPRSTAYMGGGDLFRPRDFLKFGQLFLSHGAWNGKQIVPDSWLQQCAMQHSVITDNGPYGYGWHLLEYKVGGIPIRAINAGGNGGQLLFVFPQLDMTLMIDAGNYGEFPVWRRFSEDLVPRILRGVPAPAAERLEQGHGTRDRVAAAAGSAVLDARGARRGRGGRARPSAARGSQPAPRSRVAGVRPHPQ